MSPVVRGADDGLEMWWWVVSDEYNSATAVLAPFTERDSPLTPEDRERLRLGGLRVVPVSNAELDAIQARLPIIGSVQRQWLGQIPDWSDMLQGPERQSRTPVDVGDGLMNLEPGRLRMLMRCWIEPGSASSVGWPEAALRVEFVPQHIPFVRGKQATDVPGAPARRMEDAGLLFTRFAASMALRRGEAVLLVPEAPTADWSAPPRPPADPTGLGPIGPMGPPAVPPQTIGEAMLASPPDPRTGKRVRAIIVLIARAPEKYELIRQ
jgi:hypothetical protein